MWTPCKPWQRIVCIIVHEKRLDLSAFVTISGAHIEMVGATQEMQFTFAAVDHTSNATKPSCCCCCCCCCCGCQVHCQRRDSEQEQRKHNSAVASYWQLCRRTDLLQQLLRLLSPNSIASTSHVVHIISKTSRHILCLRHCATVENVFNKLDTLACRACRVELTYRPFA